MNSLFRIHNNTRNIPHGFTLIELLVVISIIALLSSIILAALASARSSAKYGAVQEELNQMRNFYELQYSTTNSFASVMPVNLPTDGTCFTTGSSDYCIVTSVANCNTIYAASSLSQANAICSNIITNIGSFYFGLIDATNPGETNNYAFAVQNPNSSSWFCVRNSGNNLLTTIGAAACLTKIAGAAW